MSDYVPTQGQMETAWCQYAHAVDASLGRLREDDENPSDEFDRFIAKIRADALREAAGQFRGTGEVRDELESYLYRVADLIEGDSNE